jgi:stalled ribosome rescue protein Dom34
MLLETDEKRPFDRLILAGGILVRSQIELALPKRLRRKLVAVLELPVDASQKEVLAAVQQIEQEVERKEEVRTVENLLTSANKGQDAVMGLAEILQAASQGRIHKLIYADNFASDRAGCLNCGAPQQGGESRCVRCGEELQPAERLLNQIVDRVERTGGRIETVKDKAAQLMNEKDGGIGAFLRF